jgi:predicted DCC family thiol-disulfide oxidoreductase YuxK
MIDETKLKQGASVIFYDGVCGLCDAFVQFVLKHACSSKFLFCSLQSDFAAQLLGKYGESNSDLNTVFVLTDYNLSTSKLLKKSRAILFVLEECHMPWYLPWRWLIIFKVLPDFLLNIGYDFIASIRYKVFCRYQSCLIPSPEWRDKFIDI